MSLLDTIARYLSRKRGVIPIVLNPDGSRAPEYARNLRAPLSMELMVEAAKDKGGRGKALTTAQWKRVIDKCGKAGIPNLTFTSGEPVLREDLPALVEYARRFVTRLNMGGAQLSAALCGDLCKAGLVDVQITLYSCDPDIHDDLAGGSGDWERAVAGIENALDAGLDVCVDTPLHTDNAENLGYDRTLEFLRGKGVSRVSCSGFVGEGGARGESALTEELLAGTLASAAVICKLRDMRLRFTSPGQVEPDILRRLELEAPVCGACLSRMAVLPDGTVVPCPSWPKEGRGLGNMRTDRWASIWDSPGCREAREMGEQNALRCLWREKRR